MNEKLFQESANMGDYLMEKKMEIMIETTNKKILNELDNVRSMVTALDREMSLIKEQLKGAKAREPQVTQLIEPQAKRVAQPSVQQSNEKTEENVKPRYGNYQPKDVSIDKFFYFGKK